MCGSIPVAIAFSEYALVWIAVATLSHGVLRKFPPNASCGANAIACRNPSSRPHRDPISAATESICEGSFASISSTSTGLGSRRADFSVSPIARPNDVRTISAPCSCRAWADAYAIDSRVSTPVTSSFFPASNNLTSRGNASPVGCAWSAEASDCVRDTGDHSAHVIPKDELAGERPVRASLVVEGRAFGKILRPCDEGSIRDVPTLRKIDEIERHGSTVEKLERHVGDICCDHPTYRFFAIMPGSATRSGGPGEPIVPEEGIVALECPVC